MDPDVAWNELVESIIAGDQEATILLAETLLEWLQRGGFPPKVSLFNLPSDWQMFLCQKVCRSILLKTPNDQGRTSNAASA